MALFSLPASNPFAADIQDIVLNDGSRISGQVESLQNGIYTIKSKSIGNIQIQQSQIRAIQHKSFAQQATPAQSPSTPLQTQPPTAVDLQKIQKSIANNKQIMSTIKSLQTNPAIQNILSNPALMRSIQAGDINALSTDPNIQKLMNNPKIKNITNQLQ